MENQEQAPAAAPAAAPYANEKKIKEFAIRDWQKSSKGNLVGKEENAGPHSATKIVIEDEADVSKKHRIILNEDVGGTQARLITLVGKPQKDGTMVRTSANGTKYEFFRAQNKNIVYKANLYHGGVDRLVVTVFELDKDSPALAQGDEGVEDSAPPAEDV